MACSKSQHTRWINYPGAGHQLRRGQSALSGGGDHTVLLGRVLRLLGHVFRSEYQSCSSVGHRFGEMHQHVLQTHGSVNVTEDQSLVSHRNKRITERDL